MSVDYRKGLPTIEQVKTHEERGGWWQYLSGKKPHVVRMVTDEIEIGVMVDGLNDPCPTTEAGCTDILFRPCSPNQDPMPWPGEPSEGIDSLRRALSIADQKGRALAEEVERLTGRLTALEAMARNFAAWLESEGSTDNASYIRRRIDEICPQQTTEGKPHA